MVCDAVLFVGHFSKNGASKNSAASIAGDLVQRQIINESQDLLGDKFYYLSMEPCQCWPRGPVWIKGEKNLDNGFFPPVLNLPLLKGIFFSIFLLSFCVRNKPKIVLQYNSYLFENITLLLLRLIIKAKVVAIVQDLRVGSAFSRAAGVYDRLSNIFLRLFDLVVPVSKKLALDLRLREDRYLLFPGGVTALGKRMLRIEKHTENYAVFAGALEPHNGILRLLSAWENNSINIILHVFGRGSLAADVIHAASGNENIIYHGFMPQEEVAVWQSVARFNICLRYSEGLQEEYFFPSKFFNIACCPGLLVCNDFKNLPPVISEGLVILESELSDVAVLEKLEDEDIMRAARIRRAAISDAYSWGKILNRIYFGSELHA